MEGNQIKLTNEDKKIMALAQIKRKKAMWLPYLCSILMLLIVGVHIFLKEDMMIWGSGTIILSILTNAYAMYQIQSEKYICERVFTANLRGISLNKMTEDDMDNINNNERVKISWRSYTHELIILILVCIQITATFSAILADKFL